MRSKQSIGTRLLIIAGSFVVVWGVTQVANQKNEAVPDADTLATALVPNTSAAPITTSMPPPLPPGFLSMDRPPPKIEVSEGPPQPIATKFGLTYDIPADWRNFSTGVAGWNGDSESVKHRPDRSTSRRRCRQQNRHRPGNHRIDASHTDDSRTGADCSFSSRPAWRRSPPPASIPM